MLINIIGTPTRSTAAQGNDTQNHTGGPWPSSWACYVNLRSLWSTTVAVMPSKLHADHPGPVDRHDVCVATDGAGESLHTIAQQAWSGSLTLMTHHLHLSRAHTNSILPRGGWYLLYLVPLVPASQIFLSHPSHPPDLYILLLGKECPAHPRKPLNSTNQSVCLSPSYSLQKYSFFTSNLPSLKWRPILGCDCSSTGKTFGSLRICFTISHRKASSSPRSPVDKT